MASRSRTAWIFIQTAAKMRPRLPNMRGGRKPPVTADALTDNPRLQREGFPAASFHAAMAILIRNGLVTSEQDVSVEIEIELDTKHDSAEGIPSTTIETVYRTTGLGVDVLADLVAAAAPDRASETT